MLEKEGFLGEPLKPRKMRRNIFIKKESTSFARSPFHSLHVPIFLYSKYGQVSFLTPNLFAVELIQIKHS